MSDDESALFESRIAHLRETERDDYQYVVHGVAQGENELTHGLNGPKYWPAGELERAAGTLEGQPVYRVHGDGDREEIGEVLRSAYQEGVGTVYEAGLEDAEIAEELSLGQREVSIETSTAGRVDRHEETGAAILREWEYVGLATPEQGASEGNYTAAGPADSNPAVAALSAGAIKESLDSASMTDDAVSPESGPAEGMDENSETTNSDSNDTMTNENDNGESPDVSALLERMDDKDDRIEELEAELEEKEERIGELESYEDEIEEVKQAYAGALADATEVFDEDDLVDRFTVAELREKAESREDAQLASEPDVQTGGGTNENEDEEAELAQDPEVLEHRAAALRGAGMTEKANELEAELED